MKEGQVFAQTSTFDVDQFQAEFPRENFRWSHVAANTVKTLLEQLAEERGKPTSMLGRVDLITPAEFIEGRNLSGLYGYARKFPRRDDQDVMTFLLENVGVRVSIKDVVEIMRSEGHIIWERVPGAVLMELLRLQSQEAQKPVSMLSSTDFNRPQFFLDGHRLAGLYLFGTREGPKEEKRPIPYLFDRAAVVATKDDAITCLKRGQKVFWERLSWDEIGEVLKTAAEELGKPPSMLSGEDLARSFQFLGGRSLQSLGQHSILNQKSEDQAPIAFLLEKSGVSVSVDDVVNSIKSGHQIIWDKVPDHVLLDLLVKTADEFGIPVSMLGAWDFHKPLAFLDGKTLSRVYSHARSYSDREEDVDPASYILDKLDIATSAEDIVKRIAAKRRVRWERVPVGEIANLLKLIADGMGISTATLRQPEFGFSLPILNGRSLIGLYGYFFYHPNRGKRDTVAFMFETIGIHIKAEDIISQMREGRSVYWSRVPAEEKKILLEQVARGLGMPTYLLVGDDLTRTPLRFLNNRTLAGLYNNAMRDLDKRPEESVMGFIRRKMDIPAPKGLASTIRSERNPYTLYRRYELQRLFQSHVSNREIQALVSVDQITPWIKEVAKLYRNPGLGISSEEIESEMMIHVLQRLPLDDLTSESDSFVEGLRQHLEQVVRERAVSVYGAISLQDLNRDDLPIEGAIGQRDAGIDAVLGDFTEEWQDRLEGLSEIQRQVILGIVVEDKEFEEIGQELGIDSETAQEHYEDALILLRGMVKFDVD